MQFWFYHIRWEGTYWKRKQNATYILIYQQQFRLMVTQTCLLSQQGERQVLYRIHSGRKCVGVPFGEHRIAEIQGVCQTSHDGWERFVLYYTDQCPYTSYWVPKVQEIAREHNIPFRVIHITDKESAQNVPAPVTTYALFRDGKFLTRGIQSDKKFLALADITDWMENSSES